MKNLFTLMMTIFLFSAANLVSAQSVKKTAEIKADAEAAKADFLESDWEMEKHFKNSYGYVIFPNVGKGGLGVGGASGNGVAYEQGVSIGMAKLTQLTVGFQAGGQAYREIIFFENAKAMDKFKNKNYELAAQASAVAVKKGASADAKFSGGVLVFTMQKGGLMYEASVGGQKLKFDKF